MKKHYELPEHIVEIIHAVMDEKGFKHEVDAVKYIIENYAAERKSATEIVEVMDEKYNNLFTRLRLATRTAEQNSIILKDAINTILHQFDNAEFCIPADMENMHPVLRESEAMLKERLRKYKQTKDNRVYTEEIEEDE